MHDTLHGQAQKAHVETKGSGESPSARALLCTYCVTFSIATSHAESFRIVLVCCSPRQLVGTSNLSGAEKCYALTRTLFNPLTFLEGFGVGRWSCVSQDFDDFCFDQDSLVPHTRTQADDPRPHAVYAFLSTLSSLSMI